MKRNIILEKCIEFSVEIIQFAEILEAEKKFVISKQLLRCGTSIGANVFEAQHAESKLDFIHKMKLAMKEANETIYWLILCNRAKSYPEAGALMDNTSEIIRIISGIIITTKRKYFQKIK